MKVRFFAAGLPTPQGRPRRVMLPGGRMVTYSPRSKTGWEELIRWQALEHRPERLLDGPLAMRCVFFLPRPKSSHRLRAYAETRPDIDNLYKAVADALQGLIIADDARIVRLEVEKRYGDNPGCDVEVWELER